MCFFFEGRFKKLFTSCFCFLICCFASELIIYAQGKSSTEGDSSQTKSKRIYFAQSWKYGKRQIYEQKLCIKLDTNSPTYEVSIPDDLGGFVYRLVIERRSLETGEEYWSVRFLEPGNNYSLLEVSRDYGDYQPVESYYSVLYPAEDSDPRKTGYFGIPLSSKRVFAIEDFYCVIQVKSYGLNPKRWRVLDSIEIEIEFTNTYKPEWREQPPQKH